MQVKLDELIRSIQGAHNALLNMEELEDEELDRMRDHYEKKKTDADESHFAI
jgi:low affinity Fe/Cu permease